MLDSMNIYMDVSENSGTPKSSILIGFSVIFTILFGVPLFSETPIYILLTHRKLADFSSVQKLLRNADPKPAGNCDHGGGNPLGGGGWLLMHTSRHVGSAIIVFFGGGKNGAIFDLMIDYMTCERMRLNQHGIENHHDLIILIDFPWFSCHAVALCM